MASRLGAKHRRGLYQKVMECVTLTGKCSWEHGALAGRGRGSGRSDGSGLLSPVNERNKWVEMGERGAGND